MSKAFTRESDNDHTDEVPSIRLRPAGGKSYITREGADRLGRRVLEIQKEKRRLTDQVQRENPETLTALKRLEWERQKLQLILDSVIIAEPPADQQKIALGAWVRLRDEDGQEESYQIVGADEANPDEGRISSASPLGRALLTRQAGEKVALQLSTERRQWTILSVRYDRALPE